MHRTSDGRAGDRVASPPQTLVCLHLQVGSEIVEIRIGEEGLEFLNPDASVPAGTLGWDEAVALALLPDRARRFRARPAA
ncbi:MAG: hypothetical protein V3T14_08690 [Myxococcota bacterium]